MTEGRLVQTVLQGFENPNTLEKQQYPYVLTAHSEVYLDQAGYENDERWITQKAVYCDLINNYDACRVVLKEAVTVCRAGEDRELDIQSLIYTYRDRVIAVKQKK